ncbi:epoxide hydrolase 4-like [Leguminivora glycinivorella]|uniref:epoxide hydrolase 4-like n=1 Tax=Leguminivora glycinivorella TaxID=1035111 RepID=UPI00200CD7FA|nr:epoxide hydrolase 4-like [Leguminivora glycinivorella]
MGARKEVLEVVSGWQAVELVLKCLLLGAWQLVQMAVKRLWKGQRRKALKNSHVEVTVDSSIGRHCYIKIMGVKYHYIETGPQSGHKVLVLPDAPETADLWSPGWCAAVQQLADTGHHVVTLELRGTGASEGGGRAALAPPRAVDELAALLSALGVSPHNPATVIGFGIGGMLTWYLAHCHGALVRRLAVLGAPHPSLYWQYPPAPFCDGLQHFIQWPVLPERWLAEAGGPACSRARDWAGALHYVRGAAWWRVRAGALVRAPALLVAGEGGAPELVCSAQHCAAPTLRLLSGPGRRVRPDDPQLPRVLADFLRPVESCPEKEPARAGLVGRMLSRGRELTARLALPAHAQA